MKNLIALNLLLAAMMISGCGSSSQQDETPMPNDTVIPADDINDTDQTIDNNITDDTDHTINDDDNITDSEIVLKDIPEYSVRLYVLRTTPSYFDLGTSQDPMVNQEALVPAMCYTKHEETFNR